MSHSKAAQTIPIAYYQVSNQLRAAEAKGDEALLAKLELMQQMLRVRQTEKVPSPHIGQDGIIRLARAIQADIESQTDLFRTHTAIKKAGAEIFGGLPHDDKDSDYPVAPSGHASAG